MASAAVASPADAAPFALKEQRVLEWLLLQPGVGDALDLAQQGQGAAGRDALRTALSALPRLPAASAEEVLLVDEDEDAVEVQAEQPAAAAAAAVAPAADAPQQQGPAAAEEEQRGAAPVEVVEAEAEANAEAAAAPAPPEPAERAEPAAPDTAAAVEATTGKGTEDSAPAGLKQRVAALNRAGLWGPGQEIQLWVMADLHQIPEEQAGRILDELETESKDGGVQDPSEFISRAVQAAQAGAGGEGEEGARGQKRPLDEEGADASPKAGAAPGGTIASGVYKRIAKLREEGTTLTEAAIDALESAFVEDAMGVLEELRDRTGMDIGDPSAYVLSLLVRAQGVRAAAGGPATPAVFKMRFAEALRGETARADRRGKGKGRGSDQPCRSFKAGSCSFGDRCRFSHAM